MRRLPPRVGFLVAGLVLCCCRTGRPGTLGSAPSASRGQGVYHTVQHGQTLWRIAHAYNVSVDELVAVNSLASATLLEPGERLWIPRATRVLDVPPAASEVRSAPPGPAKRPVVTKPPEPGKAPTEVNRSPPQPPAVAAKPDSSGEAEEDDDAVEAAAPAKTDPPPARDARKARFIWPVKGFVESGFGPRGKRVHDGIDIKAGKGTPIMAADAGDVLYSGTQRGYGNIVLVKHHDDLITIYAHNDQNRVKAGDQVKQGQIVGVVGQTGRATNTHLHFEVRRNRLPQNPLLFLPAE